MTLSSRALSPRRRELARSDDELLSAVAGGDLGALGQLYDRHARPMWEVAGAVTGRAAALDDLVVTAFARLSRALRAEPAEPEKRLPASARARLGRHLLEVIRDARPKRGELSGSGPVACVQRAMRKLWPMSRACFALVELGGLSTAEAAFALRTRATVVEEKLRHAEGRLRKAASLPAEASCTRAWEVRASREGRLGEGGRDSIDRHAARCADCASDAEADARFHELALGEPCAPDELSMRRLRGAVQGEAALGPLGSGRGKAVRFRFFIAAGFAALTGFAILTMFFAPSSHGGVPIEEYAATVWATEGARFTQTRNSPVEKLIVESGVVGARVRAQSVDEQFVVELPDAELDVRSATFDVRVAGGVTEAVHVDHGVVFLRIEGRPELRLIAPTTWTL